MPQGGAWPNLIKTEEQLQTGIHRLSNQLILSQSEFATQITSIPYKSMKAVMFGMRAPAQFMAVRKCCFVRVVRQSRLYNIQMADLSGVLSFIGILLGSLYVSGAFHIIEYGNIGVYKRGGALLDTWTEPGLHFMMPFITNYNQVQVTLQTDEVTNIPCGTSSGVILKFQKIEVVNRLRKELAHQTIKNYTITYDQTWIFSKIHHEINQFCSSHTLQEVLIDKFNELDQSLKGSLQKGCDEWAPGIEIIAVRVTKPTVPDAIADTFEKREIERTKLSIKKEEQKLKTKQSQIEKRISKIDARTTSIIQNIHNEMNLISKNISGQVQEIENEIVTLKAAAYAKAKKYRQQKLIELNKMRLIPEKQLEAILTNIKNSQKNVYEASLPVYLSWIEEILSRGGSNKKGKR